MSREARTMVVLIVSIITYILLLPLTITVSIVKILKGVLNIIDKTLTFFIDSVREELTK